MDQALIDRGNAVLAGGRIAGIDKLKNSEWVGLSTWRGPQMVQRAIESGEQGDAHALEALGKCAQVVRLHSVLMRFGETAANYGTAADILRAHGAEAVRATVAAARSGRDPAALNVLHGWVAAAIAGLDAGAPADTPPPADPPPLPVAEHPRTTGPVRVVSGAIAPRVRVPGERSDDPRANVVPLSNAHRPVGQDAPRPAPQGGAQRAAPAATGEAEAAGEPDPDRAREYDDVNVYGAAAAMSFSAGTARGSGDPTVFISGAVFSHSESHGGRPVRHYSWKSDKIIFQLMGWELQLLLATLWNMVPDGLFLANHPEGKWLAITPAAEEKYGGTMRFALGLGRSSNAKVRTVQLGFQDRARLEALLLRQCAAFLKTPPALAAQLVRHTAEAYLQQPARKQSPAVQPSNGRRAAG